MSRHSHQEKNTKKTKQADDHKEQQESGLWTTNGIKRDFYSRVLYIILGAMVVWLFANDNGMLRFVALAAFLFAGYHFYVILKASLLIVNTFFPPKVNFEKKPLKINTFLYYFTSVFFFLAIVAQLFEIRSITNTIHGMRLFWQAAFIGFGVALGLIVVLKIVLPSVFYESKRRFNMTIGLCLACFIMGPPVASFYNHYGANPTITCKPFIIDSMNIIGKKNDEYLLFLRVGDDSVERFEVSQDLYEKLSVNGTVTLCLQTGKLGYAFVKEFRVE